jgi:hypothetical protein
MRWERTAYIVFIVILLTMGMSLFAFAQTPVRPVPSPVSPAKPHQEPCWQVAGISKSAIDQRNTVARETRQQVEEVCANSSLTPQQKQQEIKEIHEREKQQMQGLITPEQQSALRACQQERNPNPAPHAAHAPTSPCGEALPAHPAAPGTDDQKAPEDPPKQD